MGDKRRTNEGIVNTLTPLASARVRSYPRTSLSAGLMSDSSESPLIRNTSYLSLSMREAVSKVFSADPPLSSRVMI